MKTGKKWRFAGFLLLLVVSAFATLLILPFAKEGSSWGDLPIFMGTVAACLGVAALWWLASGFSVQRAMLGWLVLAVPVLAHGLTAASLVYERVNGERLARKVTVSSYAEEPIIWDGFDGPVGLKIILGLTHPKNLKMLIHPPEIRFGPEAVIEYDNLYSTLTGGSGYLKDSYLEKKLGPLALLKTVLFQRVFENLAALNQYHTWNASARFKPSGNTTLSYFVLPGIVDFLPGRNSICLNSRVEGLPMCGKGVKPEVGCASPNRTRLEGPVYTMGDDLTALWVASPGMNISAPLTAALRKNSQLQGNQSDWTTMQKRLEPGGLVAAGFRLCETGKDSHNASRVCYCREE